MTRSRAAAHRENRRCEVLKDWAQENDIRLERLDLGQRWVVYAALKASAHLGRTPVLRRIVGVSSRAVRTTQALTPTEMLHGVRTPVGGRPPMLKPEQAGPLAKFLVEHPRALVDETLAFIKDELETEVDRVTLRRFIERFGLGCLKGERIADRPLFSAAPPGGVPSS
jgi:hypothetical protein